MLLVFLLIIPILGIFILSISTYNELSTSHIKHIKLIALSTTILNLFISLIIFILFDFSSNQFQFVQEYHQISSFDFYLGIYILSIYFVLLTTIIMPIALLSNLTSSYSLCQNRLNRDRILTLTLFYLLLSNAITLRRDKSILYSRVTIVTLILTALIIYSNLYITFLAKGIELFGGLFYTYINDAPISWGLYFQDGTSPQMEAIVELHNNIMYYLAVILFGIG
jgi:NADH:ubiquinone oxidoreductase subunit 4 (subunit M)